MDMHLHMNVHMLLQVHAQISFTGKCMNTPICACVCICRCMHTCTGTRTRTPRAHARGPCAQSGVQACSCMATMVPCQGLGSGPIEGAAFFEAAMMTTLAEDECLAEVRFPIWSDAIGVGFHEVSSRKSDFAVASAAALGASAANPSGYGRVAGGPAGAIAASSPTKRANQSASSEA